ncbi:MAG: acetolactate synthase small subunit [Acidimicrobiia bacterium]|nr:MAG: acetolactate synthase small subunit [Acidimicrobiia bacterium]
MRHTLSVVVEDRSGVLARVASMFAQRAFNIHSLAVGPTHEEGRSRITLVVDAPDVEQLTKQLYKLVNVLKVTELAPNEGLEAEIMLVRVAAGPDTRGTVVEMASMLEATLIDLGPSSVTFQVAGDPDKLARFLEVMEPFGVVELVKSGRIAIGRKRTRVATAR